MATVNEKMTALADEIRTLSGTAGTIGLDAMTTSISEANTEIDGQTDLLKQISNALIGKGGSDAYEQGRKAEYDKFWDAFQNYGNLTNYGIYAFKGPMFNFNNFYPKYDIKPVGQFHYSFYAWNYSSQDSTVGSLKQRLEECGVILDTSKATYLNSSFAYGRFTELPTIDFSSTITPSPSVFAYNYEWLETIEKIIVTSKTQYQTWFTSTTGLKNLVVEGTIGQNGFDVSPCVKLTHDSLMSIINALEDKTSDISGTTWKITLGATNLVKLSDAEKAIASSRSWTLE